MEQVGERGGSRAALRLRPAGSSSWTFMVGALLFWLSVGLLAGTQEFLTVRSSSWTTHLTVPLIAGAIWVPLTVGVAALSRRYPLAPFKWSHLWIHVAGSVLAGLLLNGVFFVLVGTAAPDLLSATGRAALRWLHLNAGAYWGIVGVAHWADGHVRFREQAVGPEPVIRVRSGRKLELIPLADITWVEGAGDYARIHTEYQEHLASRRLKDLEAELPAEAFLRVHRSALVRLDRIRELRHRSHGDYEVVLDTGQSVRVSRRRRKMLMERLEAAAL